MNYELTKRVLPAILLLLITAVRTKAQSNIDFEVDGIAYHITSEENKTVEVTKDFAQPYVHQCWTEEGNYPQYQGDVIVPATVAHDGVEYTVTSVGEAFRASLRLASITLPETVTRIESYAFEDCISLKEIILPDAITYIGRYAFWGCFLNDFSIPKGVTSIGEYAFEECWLNPIRISCNLSSVGYNAFHHAKSAYLDCDTLVYQCFAGSSIERATLTERVRCIEDEAFISCKNLQSIAIPDSVTSMGRNVFSGCQSLKSVHLPGSLGTVGQILRGSHVESVTMGEGITEISWYAFENITHLRKVQFPQSLQSILGSAFIGCSNLSCVTIPRACTYLDYKVFSGCSSLAYVSVEWDPTVYTIADNTFDDVVYKNAVLYVKSGLKPIYEKAEGWRNFETIVDDEEPGEVVTFFDADGIHYHVTEQKTRMVEVVRGEHLYKGDITIPSKVGFGGKEYTVRAIADGAFSSDNETMVRYIEEENRSWWGRNDSLKSVWIEEGVESIGNAAFLGCSALTFIHLPSTLKQLGEEAFMNCYSLTSIQIPNNLTRIEDGTYSNLYSLTSLTIPTGVENIGRSAFSGLCSLTSLTISESVKVIGEWAFAEISAPSVTIPKNVSIIGHGAFEGASIKILNIMGSPYIESDAFFTCRELQTVTFHASIASLQPNAFMNCTSLRSISLPEGLRKLEKGTFYGCTSLHEVYLPASLEQLESTAFAFHKPEAFLGDTGGCDNLQVIRVADGGRYYDSRYGCNAVIDKRTNTLVLGCQNTVIPSGVTVIGDHAFLHRAGLKTIVIPEGVTSIGNYAFAGCADLESAELPQSLRSIGWCAFEDCVSLTNIRIPESVTTMGYWAFWGCENLGQVMVSAATPYEIEAKAFLQGLCVPTSLATISMPAESKLVRIYTTDGKLVKTLPAEEMKSPCEGLQRNRTYIIQSGQKSMKLRF